MEYEEATSVEWLLVDARSTHGILTCAPGRAFQINRRIRLSKGLKLDGREVSESTERHADV